jgi:Arc/MetJ-type ribon-helix-helix transcriptional regulator
MSTRRITLTLPEELLAAAEAAVADGRARSVSAHIATLAGAGEARMTFAEVTQRWRDEAVANDDELAAADEWAQRFLARNDARHTQRGQHAA